MGTAGAIASAVPIYSGYKELESPDYIVPTTLWMKSRVIWAACSHSPSSSTQWCEFAIQCTSFNVDLTAWYTLSGTQGCTAVSSRPCTIKKRLADEWQAAAHDALQAVELPDRPQRVDRVTLPAFIRQGGRTAGFRQKRDERRQQRQQVGAVGGCGDQCGGIGQDAGSLRMLRSQVECQQPAHGFAAQEDSITTGHQLAVRGLHGLDPILPVRPVGILRGGAMPRQERASYGEASRMKVLP